MDRQNSSLSPRAERRMSTLTVILDNFMKFARPGSVGLHELDVQT